MKELKDIKDLKGKRVLLRSDFNVPIKDGKILDFYRIERAISTIDFLQKGGAKIVIISHIESDDKTLKPVALYLQNKFRITFLTDYFNKDTDSVISNMKDGDIVMLENLRLNSGEKDNDTSFSERLASFGDVFVNDAFSVSHRKHASVVGVCKFLPTFFGPLFMEEFTNLSKAFNPKHPFLFILGGAKFSTKMPLVEKFLGIADKIYITGALSNDIFKAKGLSVGKSLVGEDNPDLKKLLENNPKILYPKDITVLNVKGEKENKKIDNIAEGDYVADIGEESLSDLQKMIKDFSFVLWNGPTGNYEIGFKENTEKLAEALSLSDAEVLIGGGDTVSAIQSLNILDRFSFVSTAGGAMLDFLANGTLPAIEAIQDSK